MDILELATFPKHMRMFLCLSCISYWKVILASSFTLVSEHSNKGSVDLFLVTTAASPGSGDTEKC